MPIGLFIDGSHLSICWAQVAPGRQLDFAKLLACLEAELDDRIVEAYCFDATEGGATSPRFRAMEHAGIRVKLYSYSYESLYDKQRRPLMDPSTGLPAQRRIQKGVDVGLALHMLDSSQRGRWRTLVLVGSDADFAEPIRRLVEHHNVDLVTLGIPAGLSHAIVPYASQRLDIASLAPRISRATLDLRENQLSIVTDRRAGGA
jgi:uncharacterized LabA/DUF88 family protein